MQCYSMRTDSNLLLPLEALRRVRFLSRPRSLSAPSFVAPDFSFPRGLLLSSSFLFVGDGALLEEKKVNKSQDLKGIGEHRADVKSNILSGHLMYLVFANSNIKTPKQTVS